MSQADAWDPQQYERFRAERQQPFFDLLGLVEPRPDMSVVDLGCGTGETTQHLHRALSARSTLGIDTSPAMLAASRQYAAPGLRFALARVEDDAGWSAGSRFDLLFSNACLHWVPDHVPVFAQLCARLTDDGQLAIQVPINDDHPSTAVCVALAREGPWASALRGAFDRPVLPAPQYAQLLHRLGFRKQTVQVRVYPHVLPTRDDVFQWVKGALLTPVRERLTEAMAAEFEAAYLARLQARLVDDRPFFFPFQRLLLWARR